LSEEEEKYRKLNSIIFGCDCDEINSDDEMDDIFDSSLYLNRFEKKLKTKVGEHFTKKGIM
jgi:hypothetical protein